MKKVVFHLKRHWEIKGRQVDLWDEIKLGKKTSEWRDATLYWSKRLLIPFGGHGHLVAPRVEKAWFTVGFPKNNLPRLEADITDILYHEDTNQLEVKIANVKEVTSV